MNRYSGQCVLGSGKCPFPPSTIALLLLLLLAGCGGDKMGGGSPPPPPSISLKVIGVFYGANSPLPITYAIAGEGPFTLTVNGTGFTASSVVNWNGAPLPTQFGDATDLAASVSSSLIAEPGKATVTVSDSGATSNALTLPIASPATATAGVIALISAASDGSPANGDSLVSPSISATGRYVAFQSNATNLAPGPASGFQEIYERDTCVGAPPGCTPSTTRITVTFDGSAVNGHSRDSAISADGRYVAFDSSATNILPSSGDCSPSAGFACTFLRDTCIAAPVGCLPATFAVSVNQQGLIKPGSGPQMTPDARYISFGSSSSVLGLGSSTAGDLFLRDTCIGAPPGCAPSTTRISVPSDGSQSNQGSIVAQAISSSGRFAAFVSYATNMVPNEAVVPGAFWRDSCVGAATPCTPTTIRLDVSATSGEPDHPSANAAAITSNGRLAAFGSAATNLVMSTNSCTAQSGCGNVYVRDTCAGAPAGCTPVTSLVSLANDGAIGNCNGGGSPGNQTNVFLSADGRFVSFGSISTNLTPDDQFPACGGEDIFVRDTCFGVSSGCVPSTVRVSVANTPNPGISANAISAGNAMSADGHYVVFISTATNLLPGTLGNGHAMVYLARTGF